MWVCGIRDLPVHATVGEAFARLVEQRAVVVVPPRAAAAMALAAARAAGVANPSTVLALRTADLRGLLSRQDIEADVWR